MPSSGEFYLLNKIADLANRCGLSPTVANAEINFRETDNDYVWTLGVFDIEGGPVDEQQEHKFNRFRALLGNEGIPQEFESLRAIEQVVDNALLQVSSQRARSR